MGRRRIELRTRSLCGLHGSVVVAVSRVRMVQMFADEIIGVIGVRDRLVAAALPMRVSCRMTHA